VERDFEKWGASVDKNVVSFWYTWTAVLLLWLFEPLLTARPFSVLKKCNQITFRDIATEEAFQRSIRREHKNHYANIREKYPNRLLNYELGSGWEPLCDFLGKEVPTVPFPHVNEAKEFEANLKRFTDREMQRALKRKMGSSPAWKRSSYVTSGDCHEHKL